MARRSRRSRRRQPEARRTYSTPPLYRTSYITSTPSFLKRRRNDVLRTRRRETPLKIGVPVLTKRSWSEVSRNRVTQSPKTKFVRMTRTQGVILRTRVPSRVLRKPTRMRAALVRAAKKSSKRAHACKCSEDRSELQREVTRRFIAGYGGRKNMQKKIGACRC